MGVALSIDDFGTGYSSMSYLKSLPVRELKIDRSFVIGMATDESDVVLAQSAVDLGHNLGLHVVAEGVEDATTQQALSEMGCDLVQGYHIFRPVPANDLDGWLGTRLTAIENHVDHTLPS
jgi:EAL domain-containing protein (putative c-di-GMP-specific phosphodiesterase class I)